jgi:alkylation response protein AidB-like acyl-CoA dehydrogenase
MWAEILRRRRVTFAAICRAGESNPTQSLSLQTRVSCRHASLLLSGMPIDSSQTALMAAQYEAAHGTQLLRSIRDNFAAATPEVVREVLEEAGKFADRYLQPLNRIADAKGCTLNHGRVHTVDEHRSAWGALVDAGWPALDQPGEWGGQDLPLALGTAVQERFDRACVAFGMMSVPQRAAAKLLAVHANTEIQKEWLSHIVSGRWGATICISEPDAGSDVARIRTLAIQDAEGSWRITGEKCWISYGDQDLTPRIAHCLLARSPGSTALSLFLVPNNVPDSQRWVPNQVFVRRIEHKLGLHGSPTCALGFEGAKGYLIGAEGRGLSQLFVMIVQMRLAVGTQGLGIAAGAAETALAYASNRRQGGSAKAAPVPIAEHPDVQRLLLGMVSRVEVLRGLALATANQIDLSNYHPDEEAKSDAATLAAWLLPLLKTFGGESGFEVASDALQVLGGAGYTHEWPVEQALRDARVFTIYEGTTGIQALDLLHRRLQLGKRRGLDLFLKIAREDASKCPMPEAANAERCWQLLDQAASALIVGMEASTRDAEAGATSFLELAILAATGWIAVRLAGLDELDDTSRRLVSSARYWLTDLHARAELCRTQCLMGASRLSFLHTVIS